MSFRKLSISVFTAFFGMLFLYSSTAALTIESRQINPVSVSFISSDNPNILKGKVWKKGDLNEGVKVNLELFDSQNALVLRKEFMPEEAQKKENYWEMDFSLDLSEKSLVGEYVLKAEVFNKDNRSIAFGEGNKTISAGEFREISIISDLAIKVDKGIVRGGVKFQNKEGDGEFKAKIDVYKDDNARSFMGTFSSDSFAVKKGEEKEMFFTFSKPTDSQLYHAEVSIIQQEKEITGKLVKPFLVEGDFAEFYEAKVTPEKYFGKGDTIEVDFSGITTTDKDKVLSVEINITDNAGFSAKKYINVSPYNDLKEFKGKEIFLATQGVGQVFTELILWNKNDELGRFKTSTKKFKEPRANSFIAKIKKVQSGEALSNADKYKIIAILVFIVLAIILFIRGLVRANSGKNFFIFLAMIIFSSTAFAAYPTGHFYPQNGIGYNSDLNSGHFNEMGFWGYASLPNGGLLPTTKKTINYEVKSGEKVLGTGTFENENSYEYKFSFLINSGLDDGTYSDISARLYGDNPGNTGDVITDRLRELGLSNPDDKEIKLFPIKDVNGNNISILIDSTAPNPSFNSVKNSKGFAKTAFQLTPVCGDTGIGCHTDFAGFDVAGNFCDSALPAGNPREFCKESGVDRVHKFKICDLVGNCTTESADIDFYDPVKPTMEEFGFEIPENSFFTKFPITSGYIKNFKIKDIKDPETTTENINININTYVCEESKNANGDFKLDSTNSFCEEKEVACANSPWARGVSPDGGTTCNNIVCPDNFENNGSDDCVPSCYHDRFPYCFDIIVN